MSPRQGTEPLDSTVPRIFISYRRADTPHLAGRLSDRLQDRFPGAQVFMDVDTIDPGADFASSIQQAVARCDLLIAMIGRNWLTLQDHHGHRKIDCPDDYLALEIATALDRGVPVIPLLVDEAAMPRPEELPDILKPLSRRNTARLDHETFKTDIDRILAAVDRVIHQPPATAAPATPPTPRQQQYPPPPSSPRPVAPRAVQQHPSPSETTQPVRSILPAIPPVDPTPTRPRVPIYRAALRIGLWWVLGVLSFFLLFGVIQTFKYPTQIAGGIVALSLVAGLIAFLIRVLLREIRAQRTILDRAGAKQDDPVRRPLSVAHMKRVLIGSASAIVILAVLIALTSTTPIH
jgi:TIR domain-containing protein